MSEELKPCPFCGGEDVNISSGLGENRAVGCLTCFYRIECFDDPEEKVIRYWNTRPAENALKKELTEQAANYENTLCEYRNTIKEAVEQNNALKAENESLKEKVKSEKYANYCLGETITRASVEASRAKTECVRLKEEVEELRYIVEQFASWYNENGCPKYFDSDFPCSAETEYKNDPETEGDFDEWDCWKEGNDVGCWVEYYRWKYKQEKERGCKDE